MSEKTKLIHTESTLVVSYFIDENNDRVEADSMGIVVEYNKGILTYFLNLGFGFENIELKPVYTFKK